MEKKSFVLHCDSLSILDKLTDEQCWKLLKKMRSYHNWNDYEPNDIIIDIAFESFKNQFDRDLEKFNNVCDRNASNWAKWWRPKKNPENPVGYLGKSENPEKPKKAESDSDSDNDKENDNINKKNIPPDFSEIVDYCKSRGNEVDPEKRYNFYASKWRMVGKNKMVDWRAAVRTREKKKDIDEIFQEYKKSQEDITPETKPIVWKSFIDKYWKDKMQKVLDKVNEWIGTFIANL